MNIQIFGTKKSADTRKAGHLEELAIVQRTQCPWRWKRKSAI